MELLNVFFPRPTDGGQKRHYILGTPTINRAGEKTITSQGRPPHQALDQGNWLLITGKYPSIIMVERKLTTLETKYNTIRNAFNFNYLLLGIFINSSHNYILHSTYILFLLHATPHISMKNVLNPTPTVLDPTPILLYHILFTSDKRQAKSGLKKLQLLRTKLQGPDEFLVTRFHCIQANIRCWYI